MLEVRGVVVRFDGFTALDGVDLTVGDHETVGVLGPSGSGKTTLLRVVAGLQVPDAGTVTRDGVDLAGMPPHRRDVGLMFQEQALFPHRDVLANVAFGLRMHGVARRDAERRAREMLAVVGLEGFEHRSVHELSGGEQQRVALARALAPAPSLLMLDEPLGALDRPRRERLVDDLRDLFDRLEVAVLFVTHDHDEAFALGDRVAIVHEGRIDQVGPAETVWNAPATPATARFLGWNVVERRVVGADRDGLVAVRPDALHLDARGPIRGTVAHRTFRRDHFRLRVAVEGHDAVLEAVVRGTVVPAVGETVRLGLDPAGTVELAPSTAGRSAQDLHSFDR